MLLCFSLFCFRPKKQYRDKNYVNTQTYYFKTLFYYSNRFYRTDETTLTTTTTTQQQGTQFGADQEAIIGT